MIPAFKKEQKKRPVLNGRPSHNHGLPLGLFHPVFDSFQAAMKSSTFHPEKVMSAAARELLNAFADNYESESDRIDKIEKRLSKLLGFQFLVVVAPGVKSDGVTAQPCSTCVGYLAIREIKNEIDSANSDPYNEASLSYRRYWVDEKQNLIRRKTYCPSIILVIAGPWLCVLGGVYTEKAVVQPLTDYVWLGGDPYDDSQLYSALRLFFSLEVSHTFTPGVLYIHRTKSKNPPTRRWLSVRPRIQFGDIYLHVDDYSAKLIYKARCDRSGRSLIVKFVSTYNSQAHRLLADHHLAPILHYAGTEDPSASTYGGQYMVVMDFVDTLSEDQFQQISEAITLLHSQDLVFGDLRSWKRALIGAGEGRYPVSLNMADDIGWPSGVEPLGIMAKGHDLYMLEAAMSHYR